MQISTVSRQKPIYEPASKFNWNKLQGIDATLYPFDYKNSITVKLKDGRICDYFAPAVLSLAVMENTLFYIEENLTGYEDCEVTGYLNEREEFVPVSLKPAGLPFASKAEEFEEIEKIFNDTTPFNLTDDFLTADSLADFEETMFCIETENEIYYITTYNQSEFTSTLSSLRFTLVRDKSDGTVPILILSTKCRHPMSDGKVLSANKIKVDFVRDLLIFDVYNRGSVVKYTYDEANGFVLRTQEAVLG